MFTSLAERDYVWYFVGNLTFFMAMQMQMILRGYLAFQITDAATALGLIAASVAVPMLIVAPIAGTVADRVDKRKLLMVSQTGSAVSALVMSMLIITGNVEFWHLVVVSVVTGTFMSFNMPARQAIVPQLVPQHKLMNAISLQQAGMNVTRILGPALAGLLIAPVGVGGVYLMTFVLFVVAVATELHLPKHGMKEDRPPTKFREDFVEGFRYIHQHPLIAKLLILGLVFPLFAFPLQQMLPVFAEDVFNQGPSGLGLLGVATGVGGLTGAMLAARLHSFPRKGRLMLAGGLWMGTLFVVFTQTSAFVPALIMLGLGNIGGMVFQTTNQTVIQAQLPAAVRGRVMPVTMMSFGLMPLGVLPVSIAADKFGAQTSVLGSSVALVAMVALFFVISKQLRRLNIAQLTRVELSPAQAAELVAQGKLSQAEADRLSGKDKAPGASGAATAPHLAPEPTAAPLSAPTSAASPSQPALVPAFAQASASRAEPEVPPLVAVVDPPRPRGYATQPLWAAWPRKIRRPAVLSSAFGMGMVLGFTSTGSGELLRSMRTRLAEILDPDN